MILTDDEDDNHKQTPPPYQPIKKIRVDLPAPESIPLSQPPQGHAGFYFKHSCGEKIVSSIGRYGGALIRCRRCGTLINLNYPRCSACGRAFSSVDSFYDHMPCKDRGTSTNTRAESGGCAHE